MMNTLQEILEEELADGATEDDLVVQQLRRQIAAEETGKTSEELYITGSVKKG
jgi:hypothetical protein